MPNVTLEIARLVLPFADKMGAKDFETLAEWLEKEAAYFRGVTPGELARGFITRHNYVTTPGRFEKMTGKPPKESDFVPTKRKR